MFVASHYIALPRRCGYLRRLQRRGLNNLIMLVTFSNGEKRGGKKGRKIALLDQEHGSTSAEGNGGI